MEVATAISKSMQRAKELSVKCDHYRLAFGHFINHLYDSDWEDDFEIKDKIKCIMDQDFHSGNKYYYLTSGSCSITTEGKNIGLDNVAVWIEGKGTEIFKKRKILRDIINSKKQPSLF